MRTTLIILLCFLFALSIQAQDAPIKGKLQEVTKLTLAKEDSEGNIVEDVEVLGVNDIPLYCYIDLSLDKPTMVLMKIVAIKAKRLRKNAKVVSVKYKTKKGENSVEFTAKPGKLWAEGDYQVQVYLDGKFSKSKEFKVQKQTEK